MRAWISLMRPIARMSPVGLRVELVGAVAGAAGDRQRVHAGVLDEARRLLGIGQHLVVRQLAFGADAVFLAGGAGFQRAEAADLALHRHAAGMRHRSTVLRVTRTL
jgi:hypothetical protein